MTYQDIFIEVISEVSGKPPDEVANMVAIIRQVHPVGKWDKDIPEAEAQSILVQLRSEAPGILAWLLRGAMDVARLQAFNQN